MAPLASFCEPGNVSHIQRFRWGRGTRTDPFLGVDQGHRDRGAAAIEPRSGVVAHRDRRSRSRPRPGVVVRSHSHLPARSRSRARASRPGHALKPSFARPRSPARLPHVYAVLPLVIFLVGMASKIVLRPHHLSHS